MLRFWESPVSFVVLGAGSSINRDVNLEACEAQEIEVHRRCSGGGTVAQGPGCLNYALVVDKEARPEMATIATTNHAILQSVAKCLNELGVPAEIQGISDLASGNIKFSGNAQRRRKRFILFHGTLLHAFDLSLITRCLKEPEKQPDYRASRSHRQFVSNIRVDPEAFKRAFLQHWKAEEEMADWPRSRVQQLATEKYSTADWVQSL